jgi:hypothetical protein
MGCEGSKTAKASAPATMSPQPGLEKHGGDAPASSADQPMLRKGQSRSAESLDSTVAPASDTGQDDSVPCSVAGSSVEEQEPITPPPVQVLSAVEETTHEDNVLEEIVDDRVKETYEEVPSVADIKIAAPAHTVVVEGVEFEDFDSCEVIDSCLHSSVQVCCVTEIRRLRLS